MTKKAAMAGGGVMIMANNDISWRKKNIATMAA